MDQWDRESGTLELAGAAEEVHVALRVQALWGAWEVGSGLLVRVEANSSGK
jgi:hypothetical protein